MIGYLRGKIAFMFADYVILDVGGVGYRIYAPDSTRTKLKKNEEAAFFVHTAVREDAILLYGFYSEDEYDAFRLLISVSGIGAKVALGILSAITTDNLRRAIVRKETAMLTKLPGIGKKSAERIILELKDKISFDESGDDSPPAPSSLPAEGGDMLAEATAALVALGYQHGEIAPALKKAADANTVEDMIKAALKNLNRFQ